MKFRPSLDNTEKGLEQTEKGLNWVSGKLTLAATFAGIGAGALVFLVVFAFAIFPYIEMKHTIIAGPIAGLVVGVWVYFFVSRPADLVGKATWGVWAAKHGIRFGKQALATEEKTGPAGNGATGDATASGAPPATKTNETGKTQ